MKSFHLSLFRLLFLLLFFLTAQRCTAQELIFRQATGDTSAFAIIRLYPGLKYVGSADEAGRFTLPESYPEDQRLLFSFGPFDDRIMSIRELAASQFQVLFNTIAYSQDMGPIEVIGRRNEVRTTSPYQSELLSRAAIDGVQPISTADALAELSGVYVQKSQFGGGSPVVRGFEANRVLLVVDGVRMNNAIYRNGHLQNAITVDPLALEQLEVIYGAGALAYGSDAVGGVVYFKTRQASYLAETYSKVARPQDAGWTGEASLNYSSAARAVTPGVRLEYRRRNFASLTLLSTTSTSHLRTGAQRSRDFPTFGLRNESVTRVDGNDITQQNDQPNRQLGTAYTQYNLLQKFRFRLQDRVELSANFQLSTSSDVPRYDALTERRNGRLRWARWDYGPQTRALAAVKLSDRRPTFLYDVANHLLSYQLVEEDRLQRPFGNPLEEVSEVGVQAINWQSDFNKSLGIYTLRYGLDLRYDEVASTAFLRNVDDGAISDAPINTRYPSGGSSLAGLGFYTEVERQLGQHFHLRGGLRWSRQRLDARFGPDDPIAWPADYLTGIANTESAITAALGLTRKTRIHRSRLLFSQGFRTPNIDDFAKFREQNGFVLVPNPNLQPERSNTLEAGHEQSIASNQLRLGVSVYHTWLTKAVIRRDGTLPDGSRSFVSRGDTLFVQTNVNAESAQVYGFDLNAAIDLNKSWTARTSFHYLRGRRKQLAPDGNTLTLPQDHIPPPYGATTLSWVKKENGLEAGLRLRYQLAKSVEDYAVGEISGDETTGYTFDRIGTADNLELTAIDGSSNFVGSRAWWTANLYLSYEVTNQLTLRLKADNLLDRHYRTFASGVSAPGLDVGMGLSWRW